MTTSARTVPFLQSRVTPSLIPSLRLPKAQILWIGCSDSGFVETKTLNVLPEEIIVHRNAGSVLSNDDLSASSTLEYALRILKVKHIIVCGHYSCKLVNVNTSTGAIKDWLKDVGELHNSHRDELERIEGLVERNRHLVELHVWTQAQLLLRKQNIKDATQDRGLKVHAFVYDFDKKECVELVPVN